MRSSVRALAVAAAAVGLALLASLLLPTGRAGVIPAAGALVATVAVAGAHRHPAWRTVVGGLAAAAAALALDWIVANVLGAGYPEVRALRGALLYPVLSTAGFAALAVHDHPPTER